MSNLFEDMSQEFAKGMGSEVSNAAEYSKKVFLENAEMLEEIAQMYRDGDLTKEEFEEELADQRKTLETNMLAVMVIGKVALQKAMDGALSVFKKSIGLL